MGPAVLLSPTGTVQSLCSATSSEKEWQPKKLVSSGLTLARSSSHAANMDKASFKTSFPVSPSESVSGWWRRASLRPDPRGCLSRRMFTAAVEGSIAVEETSAAAVEVGESSEGKTAEPSPVAQEDAAPATPPPVKAERFKPRVPGQKARREDPPVPAEALVAGAVFTGIVTTIQPFGAFVNFGAFTDGLVHISKLSTGYVRNVGEFVTLGQEVKVTILNVEETSGRIALSMLEKEEREAREVAAATRAAEAREGGERSRFQQGPDGRPVNRGRIAGGGRQTKRDEPQKPPTKLVKGQEVEGTVKNKIRSGVFVELPKAEEGFLRYSDIPGGENMAPEASLQLGEKIKATVLKIDRGKIVLTMKPIVDITSVNRNINEGGDSGATNPFEIAFRAFNLIPKEVAVPAEEEVAKEETVIPEAAAAVEEPASVQEEAVLEGAPVADEVVPDAAAAVEPAAVQEEAARGNAPVADEEGVSEAAAAVEEPVAVQEEAVLEEGAGADKEVVPEAAAALVEPAAAQEEAVLEEIVPEATAAAVEEAPAAEEEVVPEPPASAEDIVFEATDAVVEEIREDTAVAEGAAPEATASLEEAPVAEEEFVPETLLEVVAAVKEAPAEEKEVIPEAPAAIETIPTEEGSVPKTTATVDKAPMVDQSVPQTAATLEETPETLVPKYIEPIPEIAAGTQEALEAEEEVIAEVSSTPTIEEGPVEKKAVGVSAALVKRLRDDTGAGMMDCKRALADTGSDIDKAREALRKKGLASAEKKASRITSEGLIGSYIHDSRIGVLVEVNCETDFVSRGAAFKSLVDDVGMQVVASQQVQFVTVDDIPTEFVTKEKEMEGQREDLINKPEAIQAKIVEGRVSKRLNEIALLEQPYIRDDKILVKDLVKQTVATVGENIKVRRFERYVLGEGLQKKGTDFAAEVAAQTAVKDLLEAPKAEETPTPTPDAAPTVVVSAGLVKELRDQTGAGMMDCKKALAANENDLAKAVDFLRKKGLASADKKASRLASEGLIGTYIHDGRIGILIEVNCETDFVARGQKFKELVEDFAMQAAAYPLVQVVSVDDLPAEVVAKEKEMEAGKEDLANKPEAIRARIVDGRVAKRLAELSLLEQPFIKNDKKLVKDIVKETVASLGENIQVRRFTRFTLGEGIEKKVVDFATEVAAQTGVKV